MFDIDIKEKDSRHIIILNFPIRSFLNSLKRRVPRSFFLTLKKHFFRYKDINKFKYLLNSYDFTLHKFFVPELIFLLQYSKVEFLQNISMDLKRWLIEDFQKNKKKQEVDLSKVTLKQGMNLKPYQSEFIQKYPLLKNRFNLNGFILSFEQGLGKTITSIALSQALNKSMTIIICPNSIIYSTWYKELILSFGVKRHEIFVVKDKDSKINKDTKYCLFNYEMINKLNSIYLDDIIRYNKSDDICIIVDESHNFLSKNALRTKELIYLREKTDCIDTLLMSGTPIKAMGSELIPIFMILDPLFDKEAQKLFAKIFRSSHGFANSILNNRLRQMMYRKLKKEVLQLPPKNYYTINVKLPNGHDYTLEAISDLVKKEFEKKYKYYKDNFEKLSKRFWKIIDDLLNQYPELRNNKDVNKYVELMKKFEKTSFRITAIYFNQDSKAGRKLKEQMDFCKKVEKEIIEPLLKGDDKKEFRELKTTVRTVLLKMTAEVITNTINKKRIEMFNKIVDNFDFCDIISKQIKKTIIFTPYVSVSKHLKDKLRCGEEPLLFIGETEESNEIILKKFKETLKYNPLITTFKKSGVGLTLTEANCMIFIGLPWRDIYIKQAEDRVHRIGQDVEVNIYKVLLDTGDSPNLSTKMENILEWSKRMFEQIVEKQIVIK